MPTGISNTANNAMYLPNTRDNLCDNMIRSPILNESRHKPRYPSSLASSEAKPRNLQGRLYALMLSTACQVKHHLRGVTSSIYARRGDNSRGRGTSPPGGKHKNQTRQFLIVIIVIWGDIWVGAGGF